MAATATQFDRNAASGAGGAALLANATLSLAGCAATDNAADTGSAVALSPLSSLLAESSLFARNVARVGGVAYLQMPAAAAFSASAAASNNASYGAVFAVNSSDLFSGGAPGPAAAFQPAPPIQLSSSFNATGNYAAVGGGVLFATDASAVPACLAPAGQIEDFRTHHKTARQDKERESRRDQEVTGNTEAADD